MYKPKEETQQEHSLNEGAFKLSSKKEYRILVMRMLIMILYVITETYWRENAPDMQEELGDLFRDANMFVGDKSYF